MPSSGFSRNKRAGFSQLTFFVSFLITAVAAMGHGNPDAVGDSPIVLAPGYSVLSFPAPTSGTYKLPVLGIAGDGEFLDRDGSAIALTNLFGDKAVLLSFIYTTCDDVNGCPLATYVFSKVAERIYADESLANQVRLISLSFDPQHDTPTVMQAYGERFRRDNSDWHFLASKNENSLRPTLERYNQTLVKEFDERGQLSGIYSHILRVYLIDKSQRIRNIYSVSFLHPDTIINDLKTILSEKIESRRVKEVVLSSGLHGAGDKKDGYSRLEYETHSADLPSRRGKEQDLLRFIDPPPLGLPTMSIPVDNPLTEAKVALGRKLFFDRRLSLNQTLSCAMCHVPEQGFSHNELATAVGVEGRTVRRNAPTIYNVGYLQTLFHDARDDRLEHQVWQPLLAVNEMANPSVSAVVTKLRNLPDYRALFERAFPGAGVSLSNIGRAIASYERVLVSGNSPFDKWYFGGNKSAVNAAVRSGFDIFTGKGRCSSCHLINREYALFTDQQVHNTGIGYRRSVKRRPTQPQRVLLAPGIFIELDPAAVAESAEKPPADLGVYEITQDPDDRWKYRTPSLRNVDLTAPYMHDGSLGTLDAVVQFYDRGGIANEQLDPLIQPLGLSLAERSNLVIFLKSLTGDGIDRILSDAFSAPIGNAE